MIAVHGEDEVEAEGRVRATLADDVADPRRRVRADEADLRGALGAELVEERANRGLVATGT